MAEVSAHDRDGDVLIKQETGCTMPQIVVVKSLIQASIA